MKICTKCDTEKQESQFSKDSDKPSGLQAHCKDCCAQYRAANREKIRLHQSEYRENNREKILAKDAEYRKSKRDVLCEKQRKYALENKASTISRNAKYRIENSEKIKSYKAEYYSKNKKKIAAINSQYRNSNPEKCAENYRNRRARKRNAAGRHTSADVLRIFSHQRGLCAGCNSRLFKSGAKRFHVDHIIPLSLGGSNWPDNLQCLCPRCNLTKGAKHPDVWARENGRLL